MQEKKITITVVNQTNSEEGGPIVETLRKLMPAKFFVENLHQDIQSMETSAEHTDQNMFGQKLGEIIKSRINATIRLSLTKFSQK